MQEKSQSDFLIIIIIIVVIIIIMIIIITIIIICILIEPSGSFAYQNVVHDEAIFSEDNRIGFYQN